MLKKLWWIYVDYIVGYGLIWISFPIYYIGCQFEVADTTKYQSIKEAWNDYLRFQKKTINKHFGTTHN